MNYSWPWICLNRPKRAFSRDCLAVEFDLWTGKSCVCTRIIRVDLRCRDNHGLLLLCLCLFEVGEASSGKASKAVAKHIPGTMQDVGQRVGSVTGDISRAHMLMVERGDKLNQLEERTQRMMNESETFSHSAHSLMLKYKDKKWYQL